MRLIALACAACAAVAVVAVAERSAEACSCAPPPPPCEAYPRSAAVFVGKVTHLANAPGYVVHATFEIEEKFKGPVISKTVVVHGGGMCGAMFDAGKKYFVYASSNGGNWYASLCGRTRSLDRAKEDLAYARNPPNRSHGELIGTVQLRDEQNNEAPRAGATVVAQGTTYSAKTDQAGRYRMPVPPGKYTLDVVDPGTHVMWGRLPTVEVIAPAACASEDIVVRYNGRLRGKVTDHTGKPAVNVRVSAQGGASGDGGLRTQSDANGDYEIVGVQAGKYLVAVNHPNSFGPDPDSPIPTTYHPGVATEAGAKQITMVRSGLVEKVDIKLPKPLPLYTVTGVLRQKGRPVPGVRVRFETEILGPTYTRSDDATTDANGRYTFKDIAGAKVALEVCRPDASSKNWETACRKVRHTLTKDVTLDLGYPAP
jgi:hypothetical protein